MNQAQRIAEINPIEQALADFNDLQRECEDLRDRTRQLENMNVCLMQESNLLRERAVNAERERDYLKSEIFELDTRLDVIIETISVARSSAHRRAQQRAIEPDSGTAETRVDTAAAQLATQLIPNNLCLLPSTNGEPT